MANTENLDYAAKLREDLIEQFRGKPRIETLLEVLGRQLQDVYDFFSQLSVTLDIERCEGEQLDGIGSIVQLTRKEAAALAQQSSYSYTNADAMYRTFLYYKMFLNTAECTYRDVMRSIHMLWDGELTYHEYPESPATIYLDYEMFSGSNNRQLTNIPILKPGGVRIRFRDYGRLHSVLYAGGSTTQLVGLTYAQSQAVTLPLYLMDEDENILTDELGNILCEG